MVVIYDSYVSPQRLQMTKVFLRAFEGLAKRVAEESRKKRKRKGQDYEGTKGRRGEGRSR